MKKVLFVFLMINILLLSGCNQTEPSKIDIELELDIYEQVENENVITFEFKETKSINNEYTVKSIELLETDFAEFPYESRFLEEKEFGEYLNSIAFYFSEISENKITDSNIVFTILKPKLTVTLSDGVSEIILEFYQDNSGNIVSSQFIYSDSEGDDLTHYFIEGLNDSYSEITDVLN